MRKCFADDSKICDCQPTAGRICDGVTELGKNAERYRKLRAMVRGERRLGTGHNQEFAFPSRFELPPLGDIMRGSVAQHLDAAIDDCPGVGAG